jgi:hypothetical protein
MCRLFLKYQIKETESSHLHKTCNIGIGFPWLLALFGVLPIETIDLEIIERSNISMVLPPPPPPPPHVQLFEYLFCCLRLFTRIVHWHSVLAQQEN